MFWTRAILWKIIKVLGYLIGMVRYYPARKRNIFFVPYLTRPHVFRHTFATRAIEAGMPPQVLKTTLGHSSLAMTMDLYSHVMEDVKVDEMEKIAKVF